MSKHILISDCTAQPLTSVTPLRLRQNVPIITEKSLDRLDLPHDAGIVFLEALIVCLGLRLSVRKSRNSKIRVDGALVCRRRDSPASVEHPYHHSKQNRAQR
jgi:hypothetical protein